MNFSSNKERVRVEEEVRTAIFDFAETIGSPGRVVADMSALSRATANLPLSNFAYFGHLQGGVHGSFWIVRHREGRLELANRRWT